jgi:uncharacterized OB-fold protein
MGLTDSLRRLLGRGSEAEEGPRYECTTCGRQYDTKRAVCVDCSGRVEEVVAA